MKTKTLLIAAVMFLSISVAAFAQATYTVSASPVPLVVKSGYAEKVGSLGFSTVVGSDATVTGYIYIKYGGLPIANKNYAALKNLIQIDTFVDETALANQGGHIVAPTISVAAIEQSSDVPPQDVLVVSIYPAPAATAAYEYSFRVSGVRVDVTEWPATAPLTATIYATENLLTNGEVTTTVLYGSKKAISAFATTDQVTLNALTGEEDGLATLDATEAFRSAFGKITANDPTQNVVQTLKIKLPAVPTGISMQFPSTDDDGIWTLTSGGSVTGNDTDKYVIYTLTSDSDVAAIEHVIFSDIAITAAAPTTTLYDTSLAVIPSIALGPSNADIGVNYIRYVPRYRQSVADGDWVVADKSLFIWEQQFNNTFLMIPYATTEQGFDVGMSIANTSASGSLDANNWPMMPNLLQPGEIIFRMFDNAQGMIEVKTSTVAATLAQGVLDATGKLPSGKSYVLLLSQLLATNAKFQNGEKFTGYVLINAKFPYAHGQYYVSDFEAFTNGSQMLVMRLYEGGRFAFLDAESLGN